MTLPLAWDLRGSSKGAGTARPPPRSPPGRTMPSQQWAQAARREPQRFSCLPCKPLVPLQSLTRVYRRLKPRAKTRHQTQRLRGEKSLQTGCPELPVPLHCPRRLPGRSAPLCFPGSPAAPLEPVHATEQAEKPVQLSAGMTEPVHGGVVPSARPGTASATLRQPPELLA